MQKVFLQWFAIPIFAAALFAITGALNAAETALRLPAIFADHLVLQRDRAAPVWGWDTPGQKITVQIGAATASATAGADGYWRVDLPAQKVNSTPQELKISGSTEKVIADVLIGEVWLASGQSNMEWMLGPAIGGEQAAKEVNQPRLRFFTVPRRIADFPMKDGEGRWLTAAAGGDLNTLKSVSGVAFFFGVKLAQDLDVPVALITASWGGTMIAPWTPMNGFEKFESQAPLVQQLKERDESAFAPETLAYIEQVEKWAADTHAAAAKQQPFSPLPDPGKSGIKLPSFYGDRQVQQPRVLFDGMLAPLAPYALRGAIWYQGESNIHDGARYLDKQRALVEGWREVWNNPDLYFAFVEIAPHNFGNAKDERLPVLREAQRRYLSLDPHSGMAVITDTVDNVADIHPRKKLEVGHRLALLAERDVYGKTDLIAEGPVFQSAKISGAGAEVTFTQTGSGLATRDGAAPTLFELQGADDKWYPATAEITGAATVTVKAPAVPAPKKVRHAWTNDAQPNLMNKEGLPSSSFRGEVAP